MDEIGAVDYLTKLPDELKSKIFSYVNTFDLIQLSEIPEFAHLSSDRSVIRRVSFYKDYRFKIEHWEGFVLNKVRSELITSLNLNCVYWIPAVELRNSLGKLTNLEELYVIDTQLSLCTEDVKCYCSLKHLITIGATLREEDSGFDRNFPPMIKRLYLHIECCSPSLVDLVSKLTCLEDLWVIHLEECVDILTCTKLLATTVRKVAELGRLSARLVLLDHFDFYRLSRFYSFNFETATPVCFSVPTAEDQFLAYEVNLHWEYAHPLWHTLLNRLDWYNCPFNINTSVKLMLGKCSPEDLNYQTLDMSHPLGICNERLKSTISALLLGENMKDLYGLSINLCLCQKESRALKRPLIPPQIGASILWPNKSMLDKIVENCPRIEELELWDCDSNTEQMKIITNTSLASIQFLVNLKKLTLQGVPAHLSGEFLVDICKGCRFLESLRIETKNSNFYNVLTSALRHTEVLRDFRYEQPNLTLSRIIRSLSQVKNLQLERLVVKCKYLKKFTVSPLQSFIRNNPQMRFFCLIINGVPIIDMQKITMIMNKYSQNPQQVYIAAEETRSYTYLRIPYIHRSQMLEYHTNIPMDVFQKPDPTVI